MRKRISKHYLYFCLVLFAIFILRLPSLFEPYWYGDEGIFAAVARNLNLGGTLYQTAWDNKPPMIYLTYASIFKFFGVSMFWLHMSAAIVVLATAAAIYEIAQVTIGTRRALLASFIFGFIKKGVSLTIGFLVPYAVTFAYFYSKGLVDDYIFGAYTYYRIYLGESPKYAILVN